MKSFRLFLVATLIAVTSVFATSSASAGELVVSGARLTWSDQMYVSDGCSRYDFNYFNGTGIELLSLGFELNDPFGRNLTSWSEVGIKPNTSGTWNRQICRSAFTNGTGPYIIKLTIKDYSSTQRQDTAQMFFLALPTSTSPLAPTPTLTPSPTPTVTVTARPTPAPTVTVTATPSPAVTIYSVNPADKSLADTVKTLTDVVDSQRREVNLLKAKIKKICSAKPKPKGC
jgi:hypothetical protein